jgi:hypothetical protein
MKNLDEILLTIVTIILAAIGGALVYLFFKVVLA